jgi:hypothetical protein
VPEIPASQEAEVGGLKSKASVGQKVQEPIWKIFKVKKARDMVHVLEYLANKYKVLNSNPSTVKKKKKKAQDVWVQPAKRYFYK